jgi:hypothetical protein
MNTAPWPRGRFVYGDRVRKIRGSEWQGTVCGWYSTEGTPLGWCVVSEREKGSVQVWPDAALEPL